MELPNIYAHPHYRRLFAIPVALVLLSLISILFISPIRLGIDFKGGIDLTLQSNQSIDAVALQAGLKAGGYNIEAADIKTNTNDNYVRLQLERSDVMVKADALKTQFYTELETASNDEAMSYYSNDSAVKERAVASRAALDKTANSLFALSPVSHPLSASLYNTTSQLQKEVVIVFSDLSRTEQARLRSIIAAVTPVEPSIQEVTASLSTKFFDTAVSVVFFAILLTTAVVFIIFRTITPSIAVLSGAAADVIMAMGAMSIFGIPFTLASFSALLMLVGFSLDTDVLLTMRVLKRTEGTPASRAYHAMQTGLTMSLSAMVAFGALFVMALATHIPIYYEISAVVLCGLVGDVIATWLFNAVIILHYLEEQHKKGAKHEDRPLLSYFFKN